MNCKARICRPECQGDNCKMRCESTDPIDGQCYPKCSGSNCEMDCLAPNCEALCQGGSCTVRFSKISSGQFDCRSGNCTLTCAKGKTCICFGSGCTKKIVDDPFATNSAKPNLVNMQVIILSVLSAALSKLLLQ